MRHLPLLLIALVVYFGLAVLGGAAVTAALLAVTLPSGAVWSVTVGDAVVALGLVLLFVEILKATRTSGSAALDHALSLLVFVAALLGLLLVPTLGTGDFGLLVLMTLIDVVAGFSVSLMGARRDVNIGGGPY